MAFVTRTGGARFTTPLPVHVTRPSADGSTSEYTLPIWQTLLALFLVWANVILWSVVGIVHAVQSLV